MYKPLLYITFVTFCIASNFIEGYIYDNKQQTPIRNAEIYFQNSIQDNLENSLLLSITDKDGYFKLPTLNIDSESFAISISHIGYEAKKIIIKKTDNNIGTINLDKKIIDAEEIVVTAFGYNTHIKDTPITENDIRQSSYSRLQDIIQFAVPNMQKVHDVHGNDRVKIQGLDNKFIVFMVDGKRISGEFAGNVDFSMISISDIERIEFIKSGMSTLYGSDAMGGIVSIITKKYNNPRLSVSYNYDLPAVQSTAIDLDLNYRNIFYKIHFDYNDSPGYDLTDYSVSKTYEEQSHYKIVNSIDYRSSSLTLSYTNKYYKKKINK